MLEELFTILKAFKSAKDFTSKLFPRLKYFKDYYLKSYFYPVSIVKDIIHYQKDNRIGDSLFLNYKTAPEDINYSNINRHVFRLKVDKNFESINTYYQEVLNYINNPDVNITIRSCDDTVHILRDDVLELTNKNLDTFLSQKPNTFNGNMLLRVKDLVASDAGFMCDLQRTEYFNEVRTNLTVDFPYEYNKTIRLYDMGPNRSLRPFSDSILTNTVGVSAIWFTRCEPSKHKNDYVHFFLKPRDKNIAVYNGMLGTVSGGVKFPENCSELIGTSLEDYVAKVLLGIFYKKTQYDKYMAEKQISESDIKIIPLAFTRELLRGGLPQFFFAIETPPVSDSEIKRYITKNALYRRMSFRESFINNVLPCIFSPETMVNLLYTIQYLDKQVDEHDDGVVNLNL